MGSEKERPVALTAQTLHGKVDPEYWKALGRFVEVFAAVEWRLFVYFHLCAGTTYPVAKAVFSGATVDQLMDWIARIWQVEPRPEIEKEMRPVFAELRAISTVRNQLMHHLSFETIDKGRVLSNWTKALTVEHIKERPISKEIFEQLCDDLYKIGDHLFLLARTQADFDTRAKLSPVLEAAWRYTPPQDHSLKRPR